MKIKKLSDKIINQIAAGEVVDRPVSVVKELVENSLDAGATQIDIAIENGGKNFVTVADNGHGIPKAQVHMAFERHATSKIDEDIFDINFFGFRGEALPSIASVSRIYVESAHEGQQYRAHFQYGELVDLAPHHRERGTKIIVQDLFANLPVRLKFMKSERSETSQIQDLIRKFALINHTVGFQFHVDGKQSLRYSEAQTPELRWAEVLGSEFIDNSIAFNSITPIQNEPFSVNGRIGIPSYNKGVSNGIYIYVNNRVVRDKFLLQTVLNSYRNLVPEGKYPCAILSFHFAKGQVDVNVHPSKQEIRVVDEQGFRTVIQSEIRKVLAETRLQPNTTLGEQILGGFGPSRPNYYKPTASFISQDNVSKMSDIYREYRAPVQQRIEEPEYNHNTPLGHAKCQIGDNFIIAENGEELIIVDQHAAHERINLEQFKRDIQHERMQSFAVPLIIKLPEDKVELLLENANIFAQCGIKLERNGIFGIMIRQALTHFKAAELVQIIEEAAAQDQLDSNIINRKLDTILGNIACKKSIKAGNRLSVIEMNALLREMEKVEHSDVCNHGRPTFIKLSKSRLAKLFERG